ncbi:MAG TPA: hypothetical protein VJB91_01560 [Patescibacteria group bacterium]|nr:hypothetical protein [Patescibacteria group bacterium]
MAPNKQLSQLLMALSVVAVVLAGVGAVTGSDVYLASTQYTLVATLLAVYGLYLKP